MNIEELREGLKLLAEKEPEFLKELIGEVIKNNLCVDSTRSGDYYNPEKTYVLQWKEGYTYQEFSRAY